jgi:ATP-dependent protease ClpP protease subunit
MLLDSKNFSYSGWIYFIFKLIPVLVFALILLISSCATNDGVERLKNNTTYEFDITSEREILKGLNGKIFVNEYKGICLLILHGIITRDTPRAFKLASNNLDMRACSEREIILESNGGSLYSAFEIGRIIRARGYTTSLAIGGDAICDSSCGILFIAGAKRLMSESKSEFLGFHQASVVDKDGKKKCIDPLDIRSKQILEYAMEMLPQSTATFFVNNIMETDCNNIKRLSSKELIDAGIVTGLQTRKLYRSWL